MTTTIDVLLPHAVVYRRSWTQTEVAEPIRFATRAEAEAMARDYNRTNQDQSWNATNAYVVDICGEGGL